MSEEDDFDIVPDEEQDAPRSTWLWLAITAVVALFAFGVGVAFMVLSERMGPSENGGTPTPGLVAVAPTQTAAITTTQVITATPSVTASLTPTSSPTGTVTPTPTATPFCDQQVEALFVPLFDQARFGCPTTTPSVVWSAYQSFERGNMLWRSDRDTSYVFFTSGQWFPIEQGWDGGPSADRGAPPPGLQVPQRGFGYVWSHDEAIFNGLGWANDQEKGFCALVQDFEHGFILRSSDVGSCTPENLYNFATAPDWSPVLIAAVDGQTWGNAPSPALPPEQGGQRPAAGLTRPAPNGVFNAINTSSFTIDGNLGEWPNAWLPISAVVYGSENHSGPGDLSANFQVGWNSEGLMLALRVNDELYRPGPTGTDLWRGDSIEVQFDRQLAEDFPSTLADADDYQVGIAYDDAASTVQAYLWLPLERESALSVPSAYTLGDQGYQMEFLIPWYVFEMTDGPSLEQTYGFNISVDDNDSDGNNQETVLSASPARTTHNNPTEWGTLRFLP